MPDLPQSPTAPGVIRRHSARLCQQGLLRACVASADASWYTVVTAAGDSSQVARRDMPAYLQGIAHGAFAALHPIPRVGGR